MEEIKTAFKRKVGEGKEKKKKGQ